MVLLLSWHASRPFPEELLAEYAVPDSLPALISQPTGPGRPTTASPRKNASGLAGAAQFCDKRGMHAFRNSLFGCGLAAVWAVPAAATDDVLRTEAKAALAKASDYLVSMATEGGWLWRYQEDLSERWGENQATATQIWVQPPGTPSVGLTLIEAHAATAEPRYLTAAAGAARALLRGQLVSGGWAYLVEFDPAARAGWAYRVDQEDPGKGTSGRRNVTTFDDDNTQAALRFLLAFEAASANDPTGVRAEVQEALDYGLQAMLAAQYPNGAWPQRYDGSPRDPADYPVQRARLPSDWPRRWPKADYGRYYTLNDNTQSDCIATMLDAAQRRNDPRFLAAARRGGEFLLLAQLPEPQPAWAQQYNFAMEPAWARAFEPPAACSNESAGAMRTLIDLYLETGEPRFLDPLPAFVQWLKRSQVEPDRWARYYELGTNRPLYGDRDGEVHYRLDEISEERRRGYSWVGSYGIPSVIRLYETIQREGRESVRARQTESRTSNRPSASEVRRILAAQDAQGRWVSDGWIEMRTFARNIRILAGYCAARGMH